METIYQDFTTKLLPMIHDGLSITKDYFLDLFSRYVKYLIFVDTITAILTLLLAIAGGYSVYRGIKIGKENGWGVEEEIFLIIFGGAALIAGVALFIDSTMLLVKDIYIPEMRVIEKIQNFKNQ